MKPSRTAASPTIAGWKSRKSRPRPLKNSARRKCLKGLGGILVPGGFGERGIEGKIQAAQYARENKVPYLGLCLGMQTATIEFARNVLHLEARALHRIQSPTRRIRSSRCWTNKRKSPAKAARCAWGGSPANWSWAARPTAFTAPSSSTNATVTATNSTTTTAKPLRRRGSVSAAHRLDGKLVEMIELPGHPFFLACQFHPEFQSKPDQPHPLFQRVHRRRARFHAPQNLALATR